LGRKRTFWLDLCASKSGRTRFGMTFREGKLPDTYYPKSYAMCKRFSGRCMATVWRLPKWLQPNQTYTFKPRQLTQIFYTLISEIASFL
jgi:hypothetical protein